MNIERINNEKVEKNISKWIEILFLFSRRIEINGDFSPLFKFSPLFLTTNAIFSFNDQR